MMWAFADSMALKCAVDLRIADIINSHGCSVTIQQLAAGINSPSPNLISLSRIMRFLVYKDVFTAKDSKEKEVVFSLTPASNLAPIILAQTHEILMSPCYFSQCVKEGGDAFPKTHSSEIWDWTSANPEFDKTFNAPMACTSQIACLETLVDVGGGTGMLIREIVKANTHIRGICFDLPHVVATAPECPGIEYIGGDMFVEIPLANAVIIKSILHDWTDEECVKILKIYHKAIGENGKNSYRSSFEETGLALDLCMMAHASGKERTENEWRKILNDRGYPRYKLIQIPSLFFIIEAYPA
ncbi:hypothetical protein ACHQM5_013569 [Ranunculus cassubicifolius]